MIAAAPGLTTNASVSLAASAIPVVQCHCDPPKGAIVADLGGQAVLDVVICSFAVYVKNAGMWLADNVAVVRCLPGAVVVGQSHAHHS